MTTSSGSLTLLLTSPRVAPGLLSRPAWQGLETADTICCSDPTDPQAEAIEQAGLVLTTVSSSAPDLAARDLVHRAATGQVVWVGSPDGDPGLTDALALELSRAASVGDPPTVEVLVGSHDVTGARLLDLVAVMDRLRSPGGCPWDAAQTHQSLVPYLLEEAHEAAEAIESGDRAAVREELGDVLLQVAFHARMAQEDPAEPFDVDDVAAGVVAKLVRRHPHVFDPSHEGVGGGESADAVQDRWDAIKTAEKGRASVLDGIPVALPALARADKVLGRLERAGLVPGAAGDPLADELLALVRQAREQGRDAESVLRAGVREVERQARAQEAEPQEGWTQEGPMQEGPA